MHEQKTEVASDLKAEIEEKLKGGVLRQVMEVRKAKDTNWGEGVELHFNCGHTLVLKKEEFEALPERPVRGGFFHCTHTGCVDAMKQAEQDKEEERDKAQDEFDEYHARSHAAVEGDEINSCFIPGLGTVRACIDCGMLVAGGPTRCIACAEGEPTCLEEARRVYGKALKDEGTYQAYQANVAVVLMDELGVEDYNKRMEVASLILDKLFY